MESIYRFWKLTHNEINRFGDPRIKDWNLMSSPVPTILMSLSYYWVIKVLLPTFMKNRKPFQLKKILMVYNFIQVLFSTYLFYEMGQMAWFGKYSYKCQPVSTTSTPESNKIILMSYFYFLSKFVEFFDTVFFILRKKYNQVSPLHVFHHGVMPLGSWLCVKYAPDGNMTLICFLNSFVHAVMYSYYLLSALGPEVQKYLWWKKYLTLLQLVQFVTITIHSTQALVFGCNFPKLLSSYIVVQSLIFFYLFSKFYKTSYVIKNQSSLANGSATKKYD